jgi:hypothetical protein
MPAPPDYVEVAERIAIFRAAHPEGSLQPARLDRPWEIVEIDGARFIVYGAAAYRSPDDIRPGIGYAYEQVPGRTPYTRGSELQNAETSAWGRAIIAALAADSRKGIASADEVRNRRAEQQDEQPAGRRVERSRGRAGDEDQWSATPVELRTAIAEEGKRLGMTLDQIGDDYALVGGGEHIGDAVNTVELSAYLNHLAQTQPAEAGAS